VVTIPVVAFENWTVWGVTFPLAVVFASVCVVATTSTVPRERVPPTLRFEEVVTPVVTFVKFTVPPTLDAGGANSIAPSFITSVMTFPETLRCALLILRTEFSFVT